MSGAQALPPDDDGLFGDAAVTETLPGTPLSPRCLSLLFTGTEAVELEVTRGSYLHLRRSRTPWSAMDGPFEQLGVLPNSVLMFDRFLMRRVQLTTHEVDVIRYESL